MKFTELRKFTNNTKHIIVDGLFNEEYSFGQEWGDVPFEGVKVVSMRTNDVFVDGKNRTEPIRAKHTKEEIERILCSFGDKFPIETDKFEEFVKSTDNLFFHKSLLSKPTWKNILETIDEMVDESGDHHHRFLSKLEVKGQTLFVTLDS